MRRARACREPERGVAGCRRVSARRPATPPYHNTDVQQGHRANEGGTQSRRRSIQLSSPVLEAFCGCLRPRPASCPGHVTIDAMTLRTSTTTSLDWQPKFMWPLHMKQENLSESETLAFCASPRYVGCDRMVGLASCDARKRTVTDASGPEHEEKETQMASPSILYIRETLISCLKVENGWTLLSTRASQRSAPRLLLSSELDDRSRQIASTRTLRKTPGQNARYSLLYRLEKDRLASIHKEQFRCVFACCRSPEVREELVQTNRCQHPGRRLLAIISMN